VPFFNSKQRGGLLKKLEKSLVTDVYQKNAMIFFEVFKYGFKKCLLTTFLHGFTGDGCSIDYKAKDEVIIHLYTFVSLQTHL